MENFMMKCQAIIGTDFWYDGRTSVHTFLNARKSIGGHDKNSVIMS